VDGYDGESDNELRERYYFKVREPVTSGNIYHYKKWAFEVEGVGGVKVFPLWAGNGTVKVVVVNSDIHEADETLLKRVRDYLEEVRPIGATVTVKSAIGKAISISSTVKISKNIKFDEVKTEFETKVKEYFRKVGFKQDYVSYAQLGNILLNIQGVSDYDDLKINNTTLNVQLAAEEIPKLTTITLQKEVI
jgi:baseplate J-like protein